MPAQTHGIDSLFGSDPMSWRACSHDHLPIRNRSDDQSGAPLADLASAPLIAVRATIPIGVFRVIVSSGVVS
jgi:hypothetical protein